MTPENENYLHNAHSQLGYLVLAAGKSTRMQTAKLLLPWGPLSVIQTIISRVVEAGGENIHIVTGAYHAEIQGQTQGYQVALHFNPHFSKDEMLQSLQFGLTCLPMELDGAMILLGDQPQVQPEIIRMVASEYSHYEAQILVPSYQMHRGHPWIVHRSLWPEILAYRPGTTLRDFLNEHHQEIHYLSVNSDSILQDLDTPADYQKFRPRE